MRKTEEQVPGRPPIVDGRVPPHDLDVEAAVLSAVMLDPSALAKVSDFLKPEHFYAEAHRRIFEAALELSAVGQPFDVVKVGGWLKDRERIAQVGGMEYLSEILNAAPAVANVEPYGKRVWEKFRIRALIATCQQIAAEGYLDYGEPKAFLDAAEAKIHAIAHMGAKASEGPQHLRVHVKSAFTKVADTIKRGEKIAGMATGFERLDRLTGGLHPSDLTIIGARPGMGKTALALMMLLTVAQEPKTAGYLASIEMPGEQIGIRAVCTEGRVDLGKLRQGFLSNEDWKRIHRGINFANEVGVWVNDRAGATLAHIRSDIRRVRVEAENVGRALRIVVVDYLQLMRSVLVRGAPMNREQEISSFSRGLKEIAKEEQVAVIALAQLNRELEKRSDKRPQIADLRESGAIEQDADNILFLYRDEYYTKDKCAEPNIAELILAKQRNGPSGLTAKVRFDGEWVRFDNLAEGEYVDE